MARDGGNLDFVQFDRRVMRDHRALIKKSAVAAEILTFLVEGMDRANAIVCSYKVLEEITGYSRPTVARAIRLLKDDRWIQTIRIGSTNAYVVNSAAFWTTWGNGKQYSRFHAMIIASGSEQESSIEDMSAVKLKRFPVWESKSERPTIGTEELPPPDQQDLDLT